MARAFLLFNIPHPPVVPPARVENPDYHRRPILPEMYLSERY
jgi:polyphosphate kinase